MAKSPKDTQTPASSPSRARIKKERRPGRSDKGIAASVRQHISSIAETNRKANARRERALLRCTADLRFVGDVIIQTRDDAILAAREASRPRSNECEQKELVFYVDGSSFYKRGKRNAKRSSGAAVVFHAYGGQSWQERVFPLPRESDAFTAEMAAIAEGLAVALSQTLANPTKIHKVVIFSDCREALSRINELRQRTLSEEWLHGEPNSVLRKLITRSQYFCRIGISIELRWVPSHSGVEGNIRADRAARSAAEDDSGGPGFTNGVYLDEGLRLIELQVTGKCREDRVVKANLKRQRFIIRLPDDHLRLIPEVRQPTQNTPELSSNCADALPSNLVSKDPRSTNSARRLPQEVTGHEAGENTGRLREGCWPGGTGSDAA